MGVAWVVWESCHQLRPCFAHLKDLVFSKILPRFQGDPAFLISFCFRECKHDFTLPTPAGSSFCSHLPVLAGSTPVHLWGRPRPFPGQFDLPRAYMSSAERIQANVSPAAAKLPHALCIPSRPVPPSPRQGNGRGADCQGNHWREGEIPPKMVRGAFLRSPPRCPAACRVKLSLLDLMQREEVNGIRLLCPQPPLPEVGEPSD